MPFRHTPIRKERIKDAVNLRRYEDLLQKRRGYATTTLKKNDDAVLLLSGGLDSVGLWIYMTAKLNIRVHPIYIYRGRLNSPQYRAVCSYSQLLRDRFPELFQPVKLYKTNKPLFFFSRLKRDGKARLGIDTLIHNLTYEADKKKYSPVLPNQPSRLGQFVFAAFEYALSLTYHLGRPVSKLVYAIMPEEDAIRGSELPAIRLFSLLLCELTRDNRWEVMAPVDEKCRLHLTKTQLIKFCDSVGLSLDRTWSCGRSRIFHCGECFNCFARRQAFQKAGLKDRTIYYPPVWRNLTSDMLRAWFSFKNRLFGRQKTQKVRRDFSPVEKIRINPASQWLKEDGKLYILNEKQGYVDEYEGQAIEIWEKLAKKPHSVDELARPHSRYRREIADFIRRAWENEFVIYVK